MIINPNAKQRSYEAFCEPELHKPLRLEPHIGLCNDNGTLYKFIEPNHRIIDFIEPNLINAFDKANREAYDSPSSVEKYNNYLDWLFKSFKEDEMEFRKKLLSRLKLSKGMKVLVTGCGLGDDLPIILDEIGFEGEVHAQDICKSMVVTAYGNIENQNIYFSISNATSLPYISRYFDAVFHFGGINLFGDVKKAISEMERVCKIGGVVLFGDEGIAPHLKGSLYADIAINNIGLWATETPINLIPYNASAIELSYILGNCFYLISFTPTTGFPEMDIDVPHQGIRGGTARTRYIGKQLSITEQSKQKLFNEANSKGISVHTLLDEIIAKQIPDDLL